MVGVLAAAKHEVERFGAVLHMLDAVRNFALAQRVKSQFGVGRIIFHEQDFHLARLAHDSPPPEKSRGWLRTIEPPWKNRTSHPARVVTPPGSSRRGAG